MEMDLRPRLLAALDDIRSGRFAEEWTAEQAVRFASERTPRGWFRPDGELVWFEQHLYLQQPGYGTSYLAGKMQVEGILAARRRQLGDAFTMARFMDEFDAAGLVPASLIEWELTGQKPAHLE